jgi:hypothetical protein
MSEKLVLLFGDESHSHEVVTYAFVIVPAQRAAAVELALENAKKSYGLRADTRIHCREIFNAHARRKTEFKSFSSEDLFSFLRRLMAEAFNAGARGWVGYLDSRSVPDILLFESTTGKGVDKWNVRNLKTRMFFCYQAASGPLTHIFSPSQTKAFVDGDKTKISHFDKRRKVDSLRPFFPVEHNNAKFFPQILHGDKPPLLDLADLLAYAAARGLTKTVTSDKSAFVSIVEALDPGYSEVIFEPPAGGALFKIRAYDPQDRVKSYVKQFL